MKVAIVSGKGGSGKSSVSASFAALSERVVAADCDVDASNLPLLFDYRTEAQEAYASGCRIEIDRKSCTGCGLCADSCRFGAIIRSGSGVEAVPFLCEGCGLCVRLCPNQAVSLTEVADSVICTSRFSHGILVHGALSPGDGNSGKMIARIRMIADERMKLSGIPLQILDGPPGIGCPVLSTLTGTDRVIIVSEPTLSGVSDLKRIYRVAYSFCKDIMLIINKCDINSESRRAIVEFCGQKNIPVIAEIPFDREMVEAQLQRKTIVDYAPESVAAKELVKAYNFICSQ